MGSESSKASQEVQVTGSVKQAKVNKYLEDIESAYDGTFTLDEEPEDDMDCVDHSPKDSVNPSDWEFPFENMVMEGGGNKGLAYIGVLRCFEDVNLMGRIKRFGGTSAGGIVAALVALGYTSETITEFLEENFESRFLDHSCGYFSLIPNLLYSFGWNPGNKVHDWFGEAIEKQTGDPDYTFMDLYKAKGVELCIVVTNLNLMTAQYCHPKTTPNMPIRDALRMTMAIPGVFSPMHYDNHGQTDVFVDGGVLVNYPINCFDGWYLSMEKQDSFLGKVKNLESLPELMAPKKRFEARGPNKTVGFLLFNDSERDIMKFRLQSREGAIEPRRPKKDTALYLEQQQRLNSQAATKRAHRRVVCAVDSFLKALHKHNIDDQEYISKDDLKRALEDEDFQESDRALLFGQDCSLDKAFDILDKDSDGKIAFSELLWFIEERGIRMQMRFQGYGRRTVENFGSFLGALQETLLINLLYTSVQEDDVHRTVGINTGHIGTMNYTLEEEDQDFTIQRGYNATMAFLRQYVKSNQETIKQRVGATVTQPMSTKSS